MTDAASKKPQSEGVSLKEIYKSFEIEINCKEVNGEWEADIRIGPKARGIDSIVPVFGYGSESKFRSAALDLAKEHIDRITNPERRLSGIGTKKIW